MLDAATESAMLINGKSREDLDSDRILGLALVRLLEILGEAASRVSSDTLSKHSEVPWSEIIGLRNRLIHGDDSVDMDILWEILHNDLPP